ncbi:TetR/AcrR family transcriptional regulator [Cognatiyoonia sp. IB215182]|uniref:TetR/AcrR family transcriptional regulator n=1 Tax=Cognatiyoonia sp. IB215182 TaxID=3097353 RepID=UPI002A16C519|nr:TetR/AcrR family transcriptional regulator [Cognatiyoonia sp. IB215182]MDX8355106.1 TetR/AcrR family transcriptional regulator [Cognatiyoonia sp. IB215182]
MNMEIAGAETRRDEIIRISTQLFLENGFAGTSMSKVAQACAMTKASLYHHFTGKDALFIACVTDGYAPALDDLRLLEADISLDPADRLRAAIRILYDKTIHSDVGRMSPLIAEVSRAFPNVARSFHQDYIAPQQDIVWHMIEDGQARGVFRGVDQKAFFHLLFGPIVTLSLSREMFTSFDDLDDHFPVKPLRDAHIDAILAHLGAKVPQP